MTTIDILEGREVLPVTAEDFSPVVPVNMQTLNAQPAAGTKSKLPLYIGIALVAYIFLK